MIFFDTILSIPLKRIHLLPDAAISFDDNIFKMVDFPTPLGLNIPMHYISRQI